MDKGYWTKVLGKRISRRHAMAVTGSSAAAAAFLAACGGDDGGGGSTGGGTGSTGALVDPTSGKVGGKLIWQGYGDPGGGRELIKIRNGGVLNLAGLTHDGLLEFAYGQPKYPGIGDEVLPALAQALPEVSPDKLKVTFKLRQNVKWHNGKAFTSEDAKWTYDTLSTAAESAWKNDHNWIEKTEAPDPSTFVMTAKYPNADLLADIAFKGTPPIMERQHHESGASEQKFMGTGPFTDVEYSPPSLFRVARNPNYHTSPYPYFNEIDRLGTSDSEKKVADIISKQVHVTYWFPAEERERIKQQRRDILLFQYPRAGSGNVYIRNDVPPFNDKRVRQALSMGYDRKILVNSVSAGEGFADQALSHSGEAWGFRKPDQLKRKDLYELNLTEAKKLMAAAGVTLPLKVDLPTWNATVIGQKHVDEIVLLTTQWRNNGIVDAKILEETFGQFSPRSTGGYDTLHWGPNTTSTIPNLGRAIRDKYFAGGTQPKAPSLNLNLVNNAAIDDLVTKQLGEFDRQKRISIFHELEEVLAEEMVQCSGVTGTLTFMADPSLKNAQMPRDAYNGSTPWMKYWWFA